MAQSGSMLPTPSHSPGLGSQLTARRPPPPLPSPRHCRSLPWSLLPSHPPPPCPVHVQPELRGAERAIAGGAAGCEDSKARPGHHTRGAGQPPCVSPRAQHGLVGPAGSAARRTPLSRGVALPSEGLRELLRGPADREKPRPMGMAPSMVLHGAWTCPFPTPWALTSAGPCSHPFAAPPPTTMLGAPITERLPRADLDWCAGCRVTPSRIRLHLQCGPQGPTVLPLANEVQAGLTLDQRWAGCHPSPGTRVLASGEAVPEAVCRAQGCPLAV